MTVIRPNSVSGITSITAQANEINFFRSNGALAGLQLNGVNFNTTTGVSTFNNLDVGGVLTYQDVTNVDSLGIVTARNGIDITGGDLNAASNLILKTGGGEKVRITSEGKLGINITSPVTIIHASGNNTVGTSVTMRLQSHDTVNATAGIDLLARNNSNVNQTSKILATSGGTANIDLTFHTNNTEKLRISSSGYIGLGTGGNTSPTAPLSVKVGENGEYVLDVKGSSTKQFGLYYDQGSWGSAEFGIHEFDNSGNASKRFTIANGGKIGINNDSPDDTLDVVGTAQITSNTYIGGDIYMYGNSYTDKGIFLGGSNAVHRLDYYKTGQWVPEVLDANGSNYSITYTATECRYVRIGNLVHAYYNIQNQENGSKTGDLRMRGFPFTVKVFSINGVYFVDHSSPTAGLGDIIGGTHRITHSSGYNTIYWAKPTDKSGMGSASSRYLQHGQWSYGRWIYGSFMYEVT